jgi:alpha-L-fucosidase
MSNHHIVVPSKSQQSWQDLEQGMFCHFGLNTFTGNEWGDGTDSPHLFNPTQFDAGQWTRVAKRAGFKYLILTAKHHDGFCLWPTRTTDYSVKSSPWKNGEGDVVREVAEACQAEGILFGLYLSPWDRHEPCYADKAAYDHFYAEQLIELLTGYGPLVELWFDGAGSEGREYDWRRITALIERYQPDAMRFNMGAPTIRWVGTEDGMAPYPCWNKADSARISMFTEDMLTWLPETPQWIPAECDVPIRKNTWFWHPDNEHKVLAHDELLDIYYKSIGHGCNLLMNLAPDNRGLIPEADEEAAVRMFDEVRRRFANPLVQTYGIGYEFTVQLTGKSAINHVVLMEDIAKGELVLDYVLEALQDNGQWQELVRGSAIGHKKIDKFEAVVTGALKLRIIGAEAEPHIRQFAVYYTM